MNLQANKFIIALVMALALLALTLIAAIKLWPWLDKALSYAAHWGRKIYPNRRHWGWSTTSCLFWLIVSALYAITGLTKSLSGASPPYTWTAVIFSFAFALAYLVCHAVAYKRKVAAKLDYGSPNE